MKKSGFFWMELIVGILTVLLGIYSFVRPTGMLTGLVRGYAMVAIFHGIRDIVFCCRTAQEVKVRPALAMTAGIISLACGAMLLAYPNAGSWIVKLLLPIWFLAHSVFQLCSLNTLELLVGGLHYRISLLSSVLGMVVGIMMLVHPILAVVATSVLVGVYLILTGLNSILLAFAFRE